MAARKKRRGRRRRGRFSFLYKFLSTLLILAAMVTGCIIFFRVNTVVVVGETRYSESEILDAGRGGDGREPLRAQQVRDRRENARASFPMWIPSPSPVSCRILWSSR